MPLKLYQIKQIEAISQTQKNGISFAQAALRIGGVSQKIRNSVCQRLQTDAADYYGDSRGLKDLRFALIDTYNQYYGTKLTLPNIIISHGCIGAFASLCATFLQAGDKVLLPCPTYPAYVNTVRSFHGNAVFVPTYKKQDGTWIFDRDAFAAVLHDDLKMVVLSNPSNPLGCVLSVEDLGFIVDLTKQYKCLLVLDEAYKDYVFEGDFHSAVSFISDNPHVVKLGTFSKNFAMSGWRVGYAIASSDIIGQMVGYQDSLISCPSMPAQFAALAALGYPDIIPKGSSKLAQSRALLSKGLAVLIKHDVIAPFVMPDAGFALFIQIKGVQNTSEFVRDLLHAKQVAVVPGVDFGPTHLDYIRICYAREPELVAKGIQRFVDYCLQKGVACQPKESIL